MPSLSVIVPVYNKVKYLDSCINSILLQTHRDYELILVDDGSTDGSGERCDYFCNIDDRIIVIHQENKGVAAARNAGISHSKGQFLGFVDSDDTIEPDMYEILIKNAIKTDSDISVCSIKKTYKNKSTKQVNENKIEVFNNNEGLYRVITNLFDMSANNKVYRTALIKDIRFEGRFKEDFLFNVYAFFKAEKSVYQNTSKYNYLLRGNSVSVAKFGDKDMEGLLVDEKILNIFSTAHSPYLEEAQINFFVQNISTLNLILLDSKDKYPKEYKTITDNLKAFSFLTANSKSLRQKHRIAYNIFKISPLLYMLLLRAYILFIPSEAGRREEE